MPAVLPESCRPAAAGDGDGTGDDRCLVETLVGLLEGAACVVAADGTIVAVNREWQGFASQAGLPEGAWGVGEDLAGLAARTLPRGLATRLSEAAGAVLAGRVGHTSLRDTWFPGGQRRHLVVRLSPVPDQPRARAVVRVVDNTEWFETEEALRQATDQATLLALVAEHTSDTVAITDARGRIEWVNEAFTELTGCSRDEILGTTHGAFDPAATAAHGPAFAAAGLSVGDPEQTTGPVAADVLCRSRSGRDYWSHVLIQPVREEGVTTRWVVVGRDVTAQRLAAEQLRESGRRARALAEALATETSVLSGVLAAIPHLVYWKDRGDREDRDDREERGAAAGELRYGGVNDAFLALRGLARADDVLGCTEAEVAARQAPEPVVDGLRQAMLEAEREVVASGAPVADRRVVVERDGRARHLLLTVLPRTAGDEAAGDGTHAGHAGQVAGVIGVAADVTEITELERQLAQASRLESIGRLAAGIAHEINTPLQYVTTNTDFLVETVPPVLDAAARGAPPPEDSDLGYLAGEVPVALEQSLEGLDRVTQIVRAMKEFSHFSEHRVPIDLNRTVESTARISRNEWRYVADLDLDLDPAVGSVECYEGEIKQVLLNLVVNAAQAIGEQPARASGRERGRITVTTRREDTGVRVTVADDGPGIPDDVLPRVFDPFYTTKAVGHGTGQGLSLAYASIVQKHGGSLAAASPAGGGAVFTLVIPVAAAGG